MKVDQVVLLLLGLLVIAVPASAGDIPDHADIVSAWAVAGSTTGTDIKVTVRADDGTPVAAATVTLQCLNASMGNVSGQTFTTDSMGVARSGGQLPRFTPGTISGTAPIAVRATKMIAGNTTEITTIHEQNVDHAAPYKYSSIDYPGTADANAVVPITVRLQDVYGNPIDSRREESSGVPGTAEQVRFSVSSPQDEARFLNGATTILQPVDAAGNATVHLRVSSIAGDNIVLVDPEPPSLPSVWLTIVGCGSVPHSIASSILPPTSPPAVPADGRSTFTIVYTVFDRWMNPSANRQIDITTEYIGTPETSTEHAILSPTNLQGQSSMHYGPKRAIMGVKITARIVGFENVSRTDTVWFVNGTASRLLLTASPNPIPSWDVPGSTTAEVIAKVVDDFGNPKPGQGVTFWIDSIHYDAESQRAVVKDPELLGVYAISDENGYAKVPIRPGEFISDVMDYNWTQKATGTCVVKAKGVDTGVESITVVWKNYPYLNVDVEIDPPLVVAGEEIDVKFILRGDGWALKPKPIDAVFAMSRGLSMLKDNPDRVLYTRPAAKIFTSQMVPDYDRVGLWTFGDYGLADLYVIKRGYLAGDDNPGIKDEDAVIPYYYTGNGRTYSDYSTQDVPLTGSLTIIDGEVDRIVPFTDETEISKGTPLRNGLYYSITDLKNNGRRNGVKAVVALIDMSWDWFGDPLARGSAQLNNPEQMVSGNSWMPFPLGGPYTGNWSLNNYDTRTSWQNMSNYARDNGIKVFVVTYTSSVDSSSQEALRILAAGTGGFHRHANTPEELVNVYDEIADALKNEASVDTRMDISMQNLRVNDITMRGEEVFTYVYSPGTDDVNNQGNSTKMWNYQSNATAVTTKSYTDTLNQTDEWLNTHHLKFNLGTIHLNEIWEIQYRLRVNSSVCGDIQIFDNTSRLVFNNGADSVSIPMFTVHVPCNLTSNISVPILVVNNITASPQGEFVVTSWNLEYRGENGVTQTVSYQYQNPETGVWGDWVVFDTQHANATAGYTSSLFAQNLAYGDYRIRVHAQEDNIGGAASTGFAYATLGAKGANFIKLE